MKRIRYKVIGYMTEYNSDIDSIEQKETVVSADIPYSEDNEKMVKGVAVNGDYEIYNDGTSAPEAVADPVTWDELDASYQAGYNEGYAEGVNSAYDQ